MKLNYLTKEDQNFLALIKIKENKTESEIRLETMFYQQHYLIEDMKKTIEDIKRTSSIWANHVNLILNKFRG